MIYSILYDRGCSQFQEKKTKEVEALRTDALAHVNIFEAVLRTKLRTQAVMRAMMGVVVVRL